jgi:hypothetical protein
MYVRVDVLKDDADGNGEIQYEDNLEAKIKRLEKGLPEHLSLVIKNPTLRKLKNIILPMPSNQKSIPRR